MATTVYFPSSGSPPISPSVHSGWDNTGSTFTRRPLNISGTPSDTSMSNIEHTVAAAFEDYVTAQFISSKPLAAQTISGTVDFGFMARVTATGATFTALRIWIATPAGAVRALLLTQSANDNTVNSSSYTREFRDNLALTSGDATEGDYLVIEIGFYMTNVSSKTVGYKIGDDNAYADVTADSSTTSIQLGNCVFTDTITFVSAPTSLSYAADQGNTDVVEVDMAITGNSPTYSGGDNGTETFSISSGSLPTGLSLNTSTGEITGTPTVVGDYNFTVQVSNVAGSTTVNMLYQVYTGSAPDPEDPTPEDPVPTFEGETMRTRNAIYVVDTGSITVSNPKPILLGLMITASSNSCRIIIKESTGGVVVLDVRIEANETRQLSFRDFGGIHLSQTFEIASMEDVGCAVLYGIWGEPLG